MRGIIRVILGAGLISLGTAAAQNNQLSHENYRYDTGKQVVLKGTVAEVREYQCPVSGSVGTHIVLKEDQEIEIHLAPAAFLKKYEIEIKKGDQVEIQGAKFTFEGKPALMARVVAENNVIYAFRDSSGKPLW